VYLRTDKIGPACRQCDFRSYGGAIKGGKHCGTGTSLASTVVMPCPGPALAYRQPGNIFGVSPISKPAPLLRRRALAAYGEAGGLDPAVVGEEIDQSGFRHQPEIGRHERVAAPLVEVHRQAIDRDSVGALARESAEHAAAAVVPQG
jgi:hypothetical protein